MKVIIGICKGVSAKGTSYNKVTVSDDSARNGKVGVDCEVVWLFGEDSNDITSDDLGKPCRVKGIMAKDGWHPIGVAVEE